MKPILFNINTGTLVTPTEYTYLAWLKGERPWLITADHWKQKPFKTEVAACHLLSPFIPRNIFS